MAVIFFRQFNDEDYYFGLLEHIGEVEVMEGIVGFDIFVKKADFFAANNRSKGVSEVFIETNKISWLTVGLGDGCLNLGYQAIYIYHLNLL